MTGSASYVNRPGINSQKEKPSTTVQYIICYTSYR